MKLCKNVWPQVIGFLSTGKYLNLTLGSLFDLNFQLMVKEMLLHNTIW